MTGISSRDWAVLGAILVFSAVPALGGLVRLVELSGGTALAPPNPRALTAPLPIILHVIGSLLFCVVGALQMLPSFRRRHPTWHRKLGRVVAAGGLLSAATGLWMTMAFSFPSELQGPLLYWVRIGLGGWMIWLIFRAVSAARHRDQLVHRSAIFRAYAIGQGASTQSVLGIIGMAILGFEILGLTRDILMVSAWALNLTIAEALIRWPMRRPGLQIAGPYAQG